MTYSKSTGQFIMFGAIGVVLLVLLWKFVLKKSDNQKNAEAEAQGKKAEADASARIIPPTYSDQRYKDYAGQLYTAFNPYTWGAGTDEETIGRVFSMMKNKTDVLKLEAAYGLRDGKTLRSELTDELSASEIEEYVNAPLRRNGVTA